MAPSRTVVDYRSSFSFLGTVLKSLSLAPLFPALVAAYYGESLLPFLATTAAMAGAGAALERLRVDRELGDREALLMVSATWLAVPLFGTIPYLVAGEGTVAHPVHALFESMSGFTTTGATVLGEISVERHGRSILMWRQLTQWLGGMGIVVLMVAILSELSVGGAQVVGEEAPGIRVEKLTPRIQETARALWAIYLALTVAAGLLFYGLHHAGAAPDMDLYNAVAHALTTLPTGGFSPEPRSAEAFSPAVQWAMIPFMVVAGTNFALLWHVADGKPGRLAGDTEFRSYLLAIGVVGALLSGVLFSGLGLAETPANVGTIPGNLENALRQGLFQTVAVVTTTGYASMDFNAWGEFAQVALLFAMFLGGSAGSAAGSVKIARWYVVTRAMGRQLFTTVHPEAVRPVRLSGNALDESTVRDILGFVLLFVSLFVLSTLVLYLDALRTGLDLSAIEATSAVVATLGNVGPGFGVVGPMNSFLPFSAPAKLYMIFLMWVGRLEMISVLVLFTPTYWR
jgi:trk system potassium uptake protein TrkH